MEAIVLYMNCGTDDRFDCCLFVKSLSCILQFINIRPYACDGVWLSTDYIRPSSYLGRECFDDCWLEVSGFFEDCWSEVSGCSGNCCPVVSWSVSIIERACNGVGKVVILVICSTPDVDKDTSDIAVEKTQETVECGVNECNSEES